MVLVVLVVVVWIRVLDSGSPTATPTTCPPPTPAAGAAAPATLPGTAINPDQLDSTQPASPATVAVRVLNANGQRGQATTVSTQLGDYGFTPAPDLSAGNDTVYAGQNMACVGQIRFGVAGTAGARTLGLAVPCAEFVQDSRSDGTVDLALGTAFAELAPSAPAVAALTALGQSGTKVTADQLAQARSVRC